MHFKMLF